MEDFGHTVPLLMVVPFALMLAGIAILPLSFPHAWEQNRNKAIFSAILGLPVAGYLFLRFPSGLWHSALEYTSFLVLLGSLYAIAGGIHIRGDLQATPRTNTAILGFGAVLANIVGTTGASMLLIRVLLSTNKERKHVAHIPFFFILIVSNCAGLLTPLGDPPLFLGYLRGVPFTWTLSLWPYWLAANLYLLGLFYLLDRRAHRRESPRDLLRDETQIEPVKIEGVENIALLAGVVACIFLPSPSRELCMVLLALISLLAISKTARAKNRFSYGPIVEVAVLFAGIFVTMVPALALLEARGSALGLTAPWQFFLATGGLSSVLDNAPTYLTFLSTVQGMKLADDVVGVPTLHLVSISLGAVFMGANTYIGNGPNFMVKAIAEEAGLKMPSFFGYAWRAVITLLPVYLMVLVVMELAG